MIHKLSTVTQQHKQPKTVTSWNQIFLKLWKVVWKPNVAIDYSFIQPICKSASNHGSQFLAEGLKLWIASSTAVLIYTDGGPWQKSTLHTKINTWKNCLLSLQKLRKNSLNKKSNCLFGEAVQVKVVIFFARIKIYQWTRFRPFYSFKKVTTLVVNILEFLYKYYLSR